MGTRFKITTAEKSALKVAVREKHGEMCVYCPDVGETMDHVDPCGGDGIDNIVPACRLCNSTKNGRTPEEWRSAQNAKVLKTLTKLWPSTHGETLKEYVLRLAGLCEGYDKLSTSIYFMRPDKNSD